MLGDKKEIVSGDGSTNIQGKEVTVNQAGMDYLQVRQVAMDVFKSNFYDLGTKIEEVINARAEELINKYLEELIAESPASLKNTEDPDIRYAIYEAQKNYVRRDNDEIADLLVDALVNRTKLKEESLLKLVLNESLEVIPKLTLRQIDILTVLFIFRYVNIRDVFSLKELFEVISIFAEDIPTSEWFYQHLQFTSCTSISVGSVDLEEVINKAYQGELSDGMDLKDHLKGSVPGLLKIIDMWQNTKLKHSSLTSVGVAIALSNFKRKTNVNWDLSIWIKE